MKTASLTPAIHRLKISFDLARHQVMGRSRIEAPAGAELRLFLNGLTINSLKIDDQSAINQIEDGIVVLPAGSAPRLITLNFTKEFSTSGPGLPEGRIDSTGIALTGHWHPILDLDSQFHLSAHIPAEFEAVAEADVINTENTKNGKIVSFSLDQPLRALTFMAGPYVIKKEDFGNGKELYAYFFEEDNELAAHYLEKAKAYLIRYEKMVGEYPYKRFSIVENRLPSGFAVPTFTVLGQAVIRLPFIVDTSLGHEILHAWLGNSVRIDLNEANWAEGLTTYLADQSFAEDQARGAEFRKGQLVKYQSHVLPDNELSLDDFVGGVSHLEKNQEANRAIGYNKASMVFHMLRKTLGDDTFFASLKKFVSANRYQQAGWSDLAQSFQAVADKDLDAFFDQWQTRSDMPILAIKKPNFETKDGNTIISFKITQGTEPPYELGIPIIVKTITNGISRHLIEISAQETLVRLTVQGEPEELVIDENYDLFRHLNNDELPAVWSRFQGDPEKIIIRGSAEIEEKFAPLVNMLVNMGGRFALESELTDQELSKASLLFLNPKSSRSRSFFATTNHPESGFTLDVRANPLNPDHVAILVSTDNLASTTVAVRKLKHYAKYSFLNFDKGRLQKKEIRSSDMGQRFQIISPPRGIQLQKSLSYDQILTDLLKSRVIYVGEKHDSYADHRLQFNIIRDIYNKDPNLAIGMEMFTMSAQDALNRFLADEIDERTFLQESHYFKIWGFDYRYFRDILNFAKAKNIPVLALNLEKKTVSSVFKNGGVSSLEDDIREALPIDRDLDVPGYRERLNYAFGGHSPHAQKKGNFANFIQAQAIWDETMAENIATFLAANPARRMVVLAGRGHCDKATAIPPRVARRLDVPQSIILNNNGSLVSPTEADYLLFTTPVVLPPAARLGVFLKDEEDRVSIAGLSPHGPAAAAGIKKGDIILSLDQEPVTSVEDIKIHLLYKNKKDKLTVLLKRIHNWWPDEEIELELIL